MKLNHLVMVGVLLGLFVSATIRADETLSDLTPKTLFVPVGFDNNDDATVVIDGYMPDTCYRLRSAEVKVEIDKKLILLQPRAVRFPGRCLNIMIPYNTVVHLGVLPEGRYTVMTRDGNIREILKVKRATSGNIDDYLYAPIDSVQIQKIGENKIQALLTGRFTNTCLRLQEVEIVNSGKTLEVLPMMKKMDQTETGSPCEAKESSFEYMLSMPQLKAGRYLLHVRSVNGQAVNEVFGIENRLF